MRMRGLGLAALLLAAPDAGVLRSQVLEKLILTRIQTQRAQQAGGHAQGVQRRGGAGHLGRREVDPVADEHGLKIQQAADAAGMAPQAFADSAHSSTRLASPTRTQRAPSMCGGAESQPPPKPG